MGGLEQAPDAAGEVALEAAGRFAGALAFAASALDVVARGRVTARAGDDHAVQGRVDLAIVAGGNGQVLRATLVPEPTGVMILVAGIVGLWGSRRQRGC